jgi:hypothetical protein
MREIVASVTLSVRDGSHRNPANQVGIWSAGIATLGGLVYFLVILSLIVTGQFTFPPSGAVQSFGGIISLLFCPVMVVVMVCLHDIAPPEKRVFSQGGLAFTGLFAIAVSINRFTQLGVVRQRVSAGNLNGLDWFAAYSGHSAMFGMEILGWGWFLGLAMLIAAPVFSGGRLQSWLRWLMLTYGVLGLISAVAFLVESPLTAVGFAAWGVVLYVITGLLAVYFRNQDTGRIRR